LGDGRPRPQGQKGKRGKSPVYHTKCSRWVIFSFCAYSGNCPRPSAQLKQELPYTIPKRLPAAHHRGHAGSPSPPLFRRSERASRPSRSWEPYTNSSQASHRDRNPVSSPSAATAWKGKRRVSQAGTNKPQRDLYLQDGRSQEDPSLNQLGKQRKEKSLYAPPKIERHSLVSILSWHKTRWHKTRSFTPRTSLPAVLAATTSKATPVQLWRTEHSSNRPKPPGAN